MAPGKRELTPKLQVEALLFSSGKTMSEEALTTLTKLDIRTVRKALATLQKEYEERESSIAIFNDDTGWKMMVRELYVPTVKNIVADTELSRACMETLAIIAYKYPKVLQSEVIDIRGSGAYEHMAELEKLGFINREPSGRSYSVKLTEKFFNYFDVKGGKDIREAFKNVKVPQRVASAAQKTLGDLQVVDAAPVIDKPERKPEIVDGMEVVDVSPAQERKVERIEQEAVREAEKEQDSKFLDDLDMRIARLQQRNDDHDSDPAFQRTPLPGQEEVSTGDGSEEAVSEDAEESEKDKD
jgi:segregation and condensation protein B